MLHDVLITNLTLALEISGGKLFGTWQNTRWYKLAGLTIWIPGADFHFFHRSGKILGGVEKF